MIHLLWGFSLLFSSTLVSFYFKKDNRKCRLHTVFDFAVISVTSLLTLTYLSINPLREVLKVTATKNKTKLEV